MIFRVRRPPGLDASHASSFFPLSPEMGRNNIEGLLYFLMLPYSVLPYFHEYQISSVSVCHSDSRWVMSFGTSKPLLLTYIYSPEIHHGFSSSFFFLLAALLGILYQILIKYYNHFSKTCCDSYSGNVRWKSFWSSLIYINQGQNEGLPWWKHENKINNLFFLSGPCSVVPVMQALAWHLGVDRVGTPRLDGMQNKIVITSLVFCIGPHNLWDLWGTGTAVNSRNRNFTWSLCHGRSLVRAPLRVVKALSVRFAQDFYCCDRVAMVTS